MFNVLSAMEKDWNKKFGLQVLKSDKTMFNLMHGKQPWVWKCEHARFNHIRVYTRTAFTTHWYVWCSRCWSKKKKHFYEEERESDEEAVRRISRM